MTKYLFPRWDAMKTLGLLRVCLLTFVIVLFCSLTASAATGKQATRKVHKKHRARPPVASVISRDPYIGAIVVDAVTGKIIFEDKADAVGYPASVVKLVNMLIILEKVQQGTIQLTDRVSVSPEAVNVGGSQANLRPRESFSIDDLLYATMLKSANDAAAALAIHVAGSKAAFIELMNKKAAELGMTATHFNSVNGLPPRRGEPPDKATARDLALLARALLKHSDTLRYTATKYYAFRKGPFDMRNHNHLLGVVEGCDGLKTGYFARAGFSIIATAQQNNERLIAVVLGSRNRTTRDRQAKILLDEGFHALAPSTPAPAKIVASRN